MNKAGSPSTAAIRFESPRRTGGGWMTVYDAALPFISLLLHVVAVFHRKLHAALLGRRSGLAGWRISESDSRQLALIHVASRGEYEAALPLIQRILDSERYRVAISYSSPSAHQAIKNTDGLSAKGYLPMDFLPRQLRLLTRLDPQLLLILKHDLWPNLIRASHALGIPVIIANANFHVRSLRQNKILRPFHRAFMKYISAVWAVSETDAARAGKLISIGCDLRVIGDTRYDRVLEIAETGREQFNELKKALGSERVFIAGSSWPTGEEICWEAFSVIRRDFPDVKMIIAPHEPSPSAIDRNRQHANAHQVDLRLYSDWSGETIREPVLLIDSVGILAGLYAVGWAAYVGGGFGKGVHSVIEPTAYGIPTTFGPNHHVSHEAGLLLRTGGGYLVRTASDLVKLWKGWLTDPDKYDSAAEAALKVVTSRAGATDRVFDLLQPWLNEKAD